MNDFGLLAFILYLGYLAYRGVTGGEHALEAHLFMLWILLILGSIVTELWATFGHPPWVS